ncbi:CHAT domain-containing protein [Phytohabitans sp. LJ34]|uniref:CHAT domain-containing protein n=1 Tax=Phytohabitans sp. LJ34 TaxID=3452217 RepID=UPI003F8BF458
MVGGQDPLAAVEARLEHASEHGLDELLSAEAMADAEALAALDDGDDVNVAYLLGWFHWLRCEARVEGFPEADLLTAIRYLRRVYEVDPDAVPERLLAAMADDDGDGDEEQEREFEPAKAAALEAERHFDAYLDGGGIGRLRQAVDAQRVAVARTPEGAEMHQARLSNLGAMLGSLARETGDAAALDEAVEAGQAALAVTSARSGDRASVLVNLAVTVATFYERTRDLDHLTHAVELWRSAGVAAGDDERVRQRARSGLAESLLELFDRTHSDDAAVGLARLAREAHGTDPDPDPEAAAQLAEQAEYIRGIGERTGRVEALRETAAMMRTALALLPPGDGRTAEFRSRLDADTEALTAPTSAGGDPLSPHTRGQVDELRARLLRATPDDPGYGGHLADFSHVVAQAYERTGQAELLDEAVRVAEEAETHTPAGADFTHVVQNALAVRRITRFRQTGDTADLDGALDASNQAVAAVGESHPEYEPMRRNRAMFGLTTSEVSGVADLFRREPFFSDPDRLIGVAGSLYLRAEAIGDADAAARGMRYAERAMDLASDDTERAEAASLLSILVPLHNTITGSNADLDTAVRAGETAVAARPAGDPDRITALSNLASALRLRAHGEANGDLRRAADLLREALDLARAEGDSTVTGQILLNYIACLDELAGGTESAAYLVDSIGTLREALGATPPTGRLFVELHIAIAVLCGELAASTLAADDLDNATETARRAVEIVVASPPIRQSTVGRIAHLARLRFELYANPVDLRTAETGLRHLIAIAGPGDDLGAYQWDLGVVLRLRRDAGDTDADLDEAVQLLRESVAASPDEWTARRLRRPSLANALAARFKDAEDDADLDEAVTHLTAATDESNVDEWDAPALQGLHLYNYAALLAERYQRRHDAGDLDAAIDAGRRAAALVPPDEGVRAQMLCNLAVALHTRYTATGRYADPADWAAAVAAWREAWETPSAPIGALIRTARGWGLATLSIEGAEPAVDILAGAVDLFPALAWRGLDQRDRLARLDAEAGALARDAVAAATEAGRPDRAVELAEAGRGVVWAQVREARANLDGLRAVSPELADELVGYTATLTTAATPTGWDEGGGGDRTLNLRAYAARRLDALLDRIRALPPSEALPHPERFLRAPTFAELLPATADETVVVVNVSRLRCDAVAVRCDGPLVVPLPELSPDGAIEQAERLLNAVAAATDGAAGNTERLILESVLGEIMAWLWTAVAEPVLAALGATGSPEDGRPWPRIWWCPTGPLSVLPLHAAGLHAARDGRTVLDRAVSSYALAPSGPATGRRAPRLARRKQEMLVFAAARTPGLPPLPWAAQEAALLERLFGTDRVTVLIDESATRAGLTAALGAHPWLHVSCHGRQDLLDPSAAGLYGYDWREAGTVDIDDLVGAGAGEFAFLSACRTSAVGTRSLDESVTLAAALHHGGWRHVVGALWDISAAAALEVAEGLYPVLVSGEAPDATGAAAALHATVQRMRDAAPERPSRWAPFVHIGP